jgi:hypothetical protein
MIFCNRFKIQGQPFGGHLQDPWEGNAAQSSGVRDGNSNTTPGKGQFGIDRAPGERSVPEIIGCTSDDSLDR